MRLLSLLFTVVVSVVAFAQVPTITSFSPTSGPKGTSVTITGTGFNSTASNNTVYVDGIKASVASSTNTELVLTIPGGTSSFPQFTVLNSNGACKSVNNFKVTWNQGTWTSFGNNDFSTTTFTTGASSPVFTAPYNLISSGDFDLDGDLDVVQISHNTSSAFVAQNTTTPSAVSFNNTIVTLTTSGSSQTALVEDINNDGKLDIIIGNGSLVDIFLNTSTNIGTLSFSTKTSINLNNSINVLEALDINNDGKIDIVSGSGSDVTYILNSTSSGATTPTFNSATSKTWTNNTVNYIAKGNFNNDNYLDIVVVQHNSKYALLLGGASAFASNFSTSTNLSMEGGYSASSRLTSADLNNDGVTDFSVWKSGTTYSHFINNGSGTFSEVNSTIPGNSSVGVGPRAMDLNGDALPEVVHSDYNSAAYLWPMKNTSTSSVSFSSTSSSVNGVGASTSWNYGDINGDGKVDILSMSFWSNDLYVSINNIGPAPVAAPTIDTQPSFTTNTICAGANSGALTIAATGATSYQWQISSNAGSTWADIPGMTGTTFPGMTMNSAGTYQFRCAATNTGGTTNSNVASLTVSGNPILTTDLTTTLSQNCYNPSSTTALTVATSAGSPSYQWQVSTNNSTFTNVVTANGSGGTTASFIPAHADILYGNTKYYRCVVTSACGSTTSNSKPFGIYASLTASAFPSTADQVYCTGTTASALTVNYSTITNWPTLNYQWKESTDLTNWSNASGTGATTTSFIPSTATTGTKYYQCWVSGTCGSTGVVPSSGAITVKAGLTWNGSASNDPSTSGNWTTCGSGTGTDFNIPAGVPNYPEYTNLTISAGQTVTVESGARLTVNGILTNDGTLIINSGATLVQGSTSTIAGSGNYIVKQIVSGIGQIVAPAGRFWYLGSPVTTATSSVFFTNLTTNNTVVKKRNESTNSWTQITSGTPENLEVGRGYYAQIRPAASSSLSQNVPLTFSGTINNNPTSSALTINCTRTTGQGFAGFNLVSNPYPSYLDWDLVTKTNVGNTMWYRTATGTASNTMVFETYVAGAGIGTNLSGNVATKLIPPMQAFWVRVNSGNTTGSIVLDNSMRAHFTSFSGSTAGLRSTNDELKVFLRMNLLQEDKKDQLIVYMNGAATNSFDNLDGEKMMQAGFPQFYTQAGDKKTVINGLNSAKKQQSLPVTVELPTTGVHTIQVENLELEAGLVWLEDAQEGTMNVLNPGFNYEFYGEAGINTDRFVLHFNILDNSAPSAPNYGEVNSSANFSGKGASVYAETAGVVVIKLPASTEGETDIQIRDAAGRLVYTGSTNTLETSVQLVQANGIYYVTLNSNAGVEVRKVFIQQ